MKVIYTADLSTDEKTLKHMIAGALLLCQYDDKGKELYLSKWNQFFCEIFPDDVISGNGYAPAVLGVNGFIKNTAELGVTEKIQRKRYFLYKVKDRERLDNLLTSNMDTWVADLLADIQEEYGNKEYDPSREKEVRKTVYSKFNF